MTLGDEVLVEQAILAATKPMRLTDRQAETIYEIHSGWGLEGTFTPIDIYPGRTNKDAGGRRTVHNLAQKHLLDLIPEHRESGRDGIWCGGRFYRYRLNREAIAAFEAYAIKLDYQFPW